ncbi:hypothetical protein VZ232_32470, partial [Pseudomonas aeruginosa]|uniref:hypothetical protein n=1 Tax=Pseudomonas aeruginosa TaxID=287 RepID=UPI002E2CE90C
VRWGGFGRPFLFLAGEFDRWRIYMSSRSLLLALRVPGRSFRGGENVPGADSVCVFSFLLFGVCWLSIYMGSCYVFL